MAENEEFSMSDKQTYDMIEKVHDKVNALTEEVRKNNHIKDEVEKIHIKLDEHADQINCNSNTISNMETQNSTTKETNRNWGYWLPWVIALLLSISKIIELWKG